MRVDSHTMFQMSIGGTNYPENAKPNMQKTKEYSMQDELNHPTSRNQVKNIDEEKQSIQRPETNDKSEYPMNYKNRTTYGLSILEQMSDEEYQAFLWATRDLSESEKILMAQSLYRLTAFYQGKDILNNKSKELDIDKINIHRAFGVERSMIEDFIQRYKNAYYKNTYDKLMQL